MVRIRMKRMGRRHRPFYRINVVDQRIKRNGRHVENLGWYDPLAKDKAKQVSIDAERVRRWLSVGARPSRTVQDLLAKHDVIDAEQHRKQREQELERRLAGKKKAEQAKQ